MRNARPATADRARSSRLALLTGCALLCARVGRWLALTPRPPRDALPFYGVIAVSTGLGLLINYAGIRPFDALVGSSIVNGILAPPLLVMILVLSRDPKVVGRHRNSRLTSVLGWLTERWQFRRGELFLLPGDSAIGLRLPLGSLAMDPPPLVWADAPNEPDLGSIEARAEALVAAQTPNYFGRGGTGVAPNNKWFRATLTKVFAEGFKDYNGLSPFTTRAAGTDPSPQTQELYLQILRRPREFRASSLVPLREAG